MDLVCMGDALIDFKSSGPLVFEGFVGGSPLNVAVACARLGRRVGFASQVSQDLFGKAIRSYLQDNGVNTDYLLKSHHHSTLAFVSDAAVEVEYSFMAHQSADPEYNPQPRQQFPGSVRVVQYGSISVLQEPAATAITETVRQHRARGVLVVFDPNIRPNLIPDKAAYEQRLYAEWLPLSQVVKVSSQDLQWLYPHTPLADVAQEWLGYGMTALIVTSGSEGVTLYRSGEVALKVPTPKVKVVDAVGAGDTFTGALIYQLLERDMTALGTMTAQVWQEVLHFATKAAALNCTRAGADPPTLAELSNWQPHYR